MNVTQTCEQRSLSSAESIEELLTAFDRYLEGQRGCTEGTRSHYRLEARALLIRVFPDQRINWGNLTAGDIAAFVSGRAQKLSLVSRQNPATAIRSLLRFLTGEGLIRAGLPAGLPGPTASGVRDGHPRCSFRPPLPTMSKIVDQVDAPILLVFYLHVRAPGGARWPFG